MSDMVNHPSHYTTGKYEVIDFIEDRHFSYHIGNAVKYISRAGKKDPAKTAEDLKKALWYVRRAYERAKNNGDPVCWYRMPEKLYSIPLADYVADKTDSIPLRMALLELCNACNDNTLQHLLNTTEYLQYAIDEAEGRLPTHAAEP